MIALTESESKVIFKPLPEDDPKQRKPNISLAKEALGWEPGVMLEAGKWLSGSCAKVSQFYICKVVITDVEQRETILDRLRARGITRDKIVVFD